jgi:hypothetical protein
LANRDGKLGAESQTLTMCLRFRKSESNGRAWVAWGAGNPGEKNDRPNILEKKKKGEEQIPGSSPFWVKQVKD